MADIRKQLVTTGDVTGSTQQGTADSVQAYRTSDYAIYFCPHWPHEPLSTSQLALVALGQPSSHPASESVTEAVQEYTSPSVASADAAETERAIDRCPASTDIPTASHTYHETVHATPVTVAGWSGRRSVSHTTVSPAGNVSQVVDYDYFLARAGGFCSIMLDISFDNVAPSQTYLQRAQQLTTTLVSRLSTVA